MPKKERNKKIDKFIPTAFKPIRDEIKKLNAKLIVADSAEKNSLELKLSALSAYEEKVVSEFRTLQIEKSPPPISVLRIYESAIKETKKVLDVLKDNAEVCELVLNNLIQVTDFCSRVLTQEQGVKFFDVNVFDLDVVKKASGEIQDVLEDFITKNGVDRARFDI